MANGIQTTGKTSNFQDILKLLLQSSHTSRKNSMQNNQHNLFNFGNQGAGSIGDHGRNIFGAGIGNNQFTYDRKSTNPLQKHLGSGLMNGLTPFGQSPPPNAFQLLLPQRPNIANVAPGVGRHVPGMPSLNQLLYKNLGSRPNRSPVAPSNGGGVLEKLKNVLFPMSSKPLQKKVDRKQQSDGFKGGEKDGEQDDTTPDDTNREKITPNFVTSYNENIADGVPTRTCYPGELCLKTDTSYNSCIWASLVGRSAIAVFGHIKVISFGGLIAYCEVAHRHTTSSHHGDV